MQESGVIVLYLTITAYSSLSGQITYNPKILPSMLVEYLLLGNLLSLLIYILRCVVNFIYLGQVQYYPSLLARKARSGILILPNLELLFLLHVTLLTDS